MKTLPLAALLCLAAVPASAGVGAEYGTRDPHVCANLKAPLNAQTAVQYFLCGNEAADGLGNIYLYTDVKIDVAPAARRFNYSSDSNAAQIDPAKPVHDIRGSFREYQCSRKGTLDYDNNPGHACNTGMANKATGICWQSTFGEWNCRLFDGSLALSQVHVPPPKN